MLQNEDGLIPRTPADGPCLTFDFPGLRIGIAEYDEGPTGCTVLHFPEGAQCEVDVRGGSTGLFGGYGHADAVFLAGGSLYGLEAGTGVAAEILAQRQTAVWGQIACVSGAIIYDFGVRESLCYPDKTLGRAAFRAAVAGRFPQGRQGAGRSASVGKLNASQRFMGEAGGQGAAVEVRGELTIAVFTVVNSLGVILDENGQVLRGLRDSETGRRFHLREIIEQHPQEVAGTEHSAGGNTTISAIVVNQVLTPYELRQLGRQVHASMARVIQPFHTIRDGDIMFALSTGAVAPTLSVMAMGEIGSCLAERAVRSAVTAPNRP